jgi:hypothetical protein
MKMLSGWIENRRLLWEMGGFVFISDVNIWDWSSWNQEVIPKIVNVVHSKAGIKVFGRD